MVLSKLFFINPVPGQMFGTDVLSSCMVYSKLMHNESMLLYAKFTINTHFALPCKITAWQRDVACIGYLRKT